MHWSLYAVTLNHEAPAAAVKMPGERSSRIRRTRASGSMHWSLYAVTLNHEAPAAAVKMPGERSSRTRRTRASRSMHWSLYAVTLNHEALASLADCGGCRLPVVWVALEPFWNAGRSTYQWIVQGWGVFCALIALATGFFIACFQRFKKMPILSTRYFTRKRV